jgi:exodeoxyribonuclease VII large subunit
VAGCPVPVVSAVGHEQDTPLCDLAADARASTPTSAARLVVPDLDELVAGLARSRERLGTGVRRLVARDRERLVRTAARLRSAPRLLIERRRAALVSSGGRLHVLSPQATLERGYAIARSGATVLRTATDLEVGERIAVQLAAGSIGARVEDVTP